MSRICPRCQGSGKNGEDLCRACNSSAAIGDRLVGLGQRMADRATGRSLRLTTGGVVSTSRGRQTVSLPDDTIPPDRRPKPEKGCVRCRQETAPLKWTSKGAVCLSGCAKPAPAKQETKPAGKKATAPKAKATTRKKAA